MAGSVSGAFFKSRSLLGCISVSFKFLSDNLLQLLKWGVALLLPVALVSALYGLLRSMAVFESTGVLWAGIVSCLFCIAGYFCFTALIYAFLKRFSQDGTLPAFSLKEVGRWVAPELKRVSVSGLFILVVLALCAAVVFLLCRWSVCTLFASVPVLVVCLLPLWGYMMNIYVWEDVSFGKALAKSFRLGFSTWGTLLAVALVSLGVAVWVQVVFALPFVLSSLAFGASVSSASGELPSFFPVLVFVFSFIAVCAVYFSMAVMVVFSAFQYGSAETCRKERLTETA